MSPLGEAVVILRISGVFPLSFARDAQQQRAADAGGKSQVKTGDRESRIRVDRATGRCRLPAQFDVSGELNEKLPTELSGLILFFLRRMTLAPNFRLLAP